MDDVQMSEASESGQKQTISETLSAEESKIQKLCELAYILEQDEDRLDAAEKAYTRVFETAPTDPMINFAFASFHIRKNLRKLQQSQGLQEQVKGALDVASRNEETNNSELHNMLAILYCKVLGDFEAACLAFDKSLEKDCNNIDALYNYGNFLDQALGDTKRASELYENVLQIDPEHVTTLNNYAAQLVENSKQCNPDSHEQKSLLDKARLLFERAHKISPGLPAFNLACVASLQRENERAKFWLQETFKLELIETGEAGIQFLTEDPDLQNIQNEKWFLQMCENLRLNRALDLEVLQPKETTFDYSIDFFGETINLKQPDSLCHEVDSEDGKVRGTTGWTIWNANFVVLRYLERLHANRSWWKGKRILDLSAGLGLVGIACAKLGADVTITEVGSEQLECIKKNVDLNNVASSVQVAELAWGDEVALNKVCMKNEQQMQYDLVIASDLMYIGIRDSIQELLVRTLEGLIIQGSKKIILVYEERMRREEERILEMLGKNLQLYKHLASDICVDDLSKDESINQDGGLGLEAMMHEELTFHMWTISSLT